MGQEARGVASNDSTLSGLEICCGLEPRVGSANPGLTDGTPLGFPDGGDMRCIWSGLIGLVVSG